MKAQDRLTIKNFGPIKNISIEVKDVNILIGPTSSGKSIVAKVIAIITSRDFLAKNTMEEFKKQLKEYNIDIDFDENSKIRYVTKNYFWEFTKDNLETNFKLKSVVSSIPTILEEGLELSERSLFSTASFRHALALILLSTMSKQDLDGIAESAKDKADVTKSIERIKKHIDNINNNQFDEVQSFVKELRNIIKVIEKDLNVFMPTYIPAERILISMVGESLFSMLENRVSIAQCLVDFGSNFEKARRKTNNVDINFLNAKYLFSDKENKIELNNGTTIKLEHASSGFQSIVPLLLVLKNISPNKALNRNLLIIEEPELNLYPSAQKELIEEIINVTNRNNIRLIITTHSPYTLTTLDNMIQANNAYEMHAEKKRTISRTMPEQLWMNFNKVTCHYLSDGMSKSTLDRKLKTIGSSNIDDVSITLGKTFDKLLDIKYS